MLTFAAEEDSLRISSSAVIPLDQAGEDFDVITAETTRRLVAANGDANPAVFVIGHGPNGDMLADRVVEGMRPGLPEDSQPVALHNDGENVSARISPRP